MPGNFDELIRQALQEAADKEAIRKYYLEHGRGITGSEVADERSKQQINQVRQDTRDPRGTEE